MGDMGDLWREHNADIKKKKQNRLAIETLEIKELAKQYNAHLEMVQYYHFRVRRKETSKHFIDVFPMKHRCFVSKEQRWYNYQHLKEIFVDIAMASD